MTMNAQVSMHSNRFIRLISMFLCCFIAVIMCICSFGNDLLNVSAGSGSTLKQVTTFSYTGNVQTFVASVSGTYVIELGGGAGGDGSFGSTSGGKGGYVKFTTDLSAGDTLYVYVGGRGYSTGWENTVTASRGNGTTSSGGSAAGPYAAAGGSATEVRLNSTSISNRIAIAGGGGGASKSVNGLDAYVATSGNNGDTSGAGSSAGSYGGGGGGGYRGGSCGSTSAAAHGGSNWVNGSSRYIVNANTVAGSKSEGYCVISLLSDYICKIDPNGGVFNSSTKPSIYTLDTSTADSRASFGYVGYTQAYTAPYEGYYYIEACGARGGDNEAAGGYGGYVKAYVYLRANQTIYVTCGGRGITARGTGGGYNGGAAAGSAGQPACSGGCGGCSGGGGGCTSITTTNRGVLTNYASYKNEVLVVAGGGSGGSAASIGEGGTVLYVGDGNTYPGTVQNGASTSKLISGLFGQGQYPGYSADGGGGGAGWVGGKGGLDTAGNPAGGGASYVCTANGSLAIGLQANYNSGNGWCNISYVSDMIVVDNPVREGYTFSGWTKSGNGSLSYNVYANTHIFTYGVGTTTLMANWTKIPGYGTLTVNPNGGSYNGFVDNTIISRYNGQYVNIGVPIRYGYDFTGWSFSGAGTWNSSSSQYTFGYETVATLTANWTKHKSNLTVDPNGGVYQSSTDKKYYASMEYGSITPIDTPSRVGYQFMYWSELNASDGWLDTSGWHYATSDAYLQAVWDANIYTVQYYANKPSLASHNVSGSQATQTCRYDSTYNFNQNSECANGSVGYTLVGWHFTGWNTKADGTGTSYAAGQSFKNLTATQYGVIKLYAQWEQNTYTISYDKNTGLLKSGADGSVKTVVKYEDTVLDLIDVSDLFYKTGYHIDSSVAWLFGSTSGMSYPETATSSSTYLNLIKTAIERSKSVSSTVYANWIENTYSIHFDKNTPLRASSSVQGSMSDMADLLWTRDYTLSNNNYSLTGWTFKGWSLSPTDYAAVTPGDFAAVDYHNVQTINNKNDSKLSDDNEVVITLYAIWQENRYNVVFDGNNDTGYVTGFTEPMTDVLYESFVNLNANAFNRTSPVNMEYRDGEWRNIESVFLGWNYDIDDGQDVVYTDGQEVSKLSATNNSTVMLYAVWNDNPTFNIQAEFPDRYFTLSEAQNGIITEEELLSTVTASDREGILSIELVGFEPDDYTSMTTPGVESQTYKVTDTYGRYSYVTISVYVLENDSVHHAGEQTIRGYDSEYYKYSDGQFIEASEGGLAETSRWLTDDAYNTILEYTILSRGTSDNAVYSFSSSDLDTIRNSVLMNGIGTTDNMSLTSAFMQYVNSNRKQN